MNVINKLRKVMHHMNDMDAAARGILPSCHTQPVLAELDDETQMLRIDLEQKLEAAKAYLGKNWVHHRDYVPIPRHSHNVSYWWPYRLLQNGETKLPDLSTFSSFIPA